MARMTVHPHVCGENYRKGTQGQGRGGSPPRVWGKQTATSEEDIASRFTPTCVGKTLNLS